MANNRLFTGEPSYRDKDGYVYVKFDPELHRGYDSMFNRNYVPEHRIAFAKSIGRPLQKHEHVHHKDRNRENNNPENLEMHDPKFHVKSHIEEGHFRIFSKEYQPRWGKNPYVKKASSKFDPKQVAMGMQVEKEHNDVTHGKKSLIRKIVNAHLKELPDYYTRINKMEKGAGIIEKIIEDREAPRKYIADVTKVTSLPESDVKTYVKNLKPHRVFVSPADFAEDVKDLHKLRSQYDLLGSNEDLKTSSKHQKNMNGIFQTWIQKHNDVYKKYTGQDNPKFLESLDKFKGKLKKEKEEKKYYKKLLGKKASALPFIAGGTLIGATAPLLHYQFRKKDQWNEDRQKAEKRKAIERSIVGGVVGGVAGNITGNYISGRAKHKVNEDAAWKNLTFGKPILGGTTGTILGSAPGVVDYIRAKNDEEKENKAKKKILWGGSIGATLGTTNSLMGQLK